MSKKILIVDDDPVYSEMVKTFLESLGYLVWRVVDTSALAARIKKGDLPDLFVVDMQMPGGGGPGAVKNLREDAATKDIPIIMCSAMPTHHQESWFKTQPKIRFLQKPVELVDLQGHVQDLLR
jgi:twitching motility two-component system response regulator PilH